MKHLVVLSLYCFLFQMSKAQESSCSCLHWPGKEEKTNSAVTEDVWLCRGDYTSLFLMNGKIVSGRVVSIQPDSLQITTALSAAVAEKIAVSFDTLKIPITELQKIRLIADRSLGLYSHKKLNNYACHYLSDSTMQRCGPFFTQLYSNDSALYELVPIFTAQGYDYIFEENGNSYYYRGMLGERSDTSVKDTTYRVRNFFAFTPVKCEEINGIAIGFLTENSKNDYLQERDSLIVRGLALEVDVFQIFLVFYAHSYIQFYDDWNYFEESLRPQWSSRVKGVHIAMGITSAVEDSGLSIAPIAIMASSTTGCSIGGLYNASFLQRGLAIAGLHCRSARTRGIQLSLYNKSSDLRGIQIGLWNTNPKRSLPFINWQFSPKKPRS